MVNPIIHMQYEQLEAVADRFQRATTTITSLRQQLHHDWHGASVLLDGTIIGTDGTITKLGGGWIPLAGTRLNPDGSYTLSDRMLER